MLTSYLSFTDINPHILVLQFPMKFQNILSYLQRQELYLKDV